MQDLYNPFKYGVPVSKEDFADREEERKELVSALLSGQSVILYSSRRMGKTSLIKQMALSIPKKEATLAYVDLFGISSKKALIKKLVNALFSAAYPKLFALEKAVEKILKKIPVKVTLLKGTVTIERLIEKEPQIEELEEAFDLAEKIAEHINKRMIVVFDEFQDVVQLDAEKIEKLMRAKFQHHKKASYLFAGSKTSLMQAIFADPTRAFYRFGKIMKIGLLPTQVFSSFIKKKFKNTGKRISIDAIEDVLSFTNTHPYFTQKLCWHLWYITKKNVSAEDISSAIEKTINHDSEFYEEQWDSLTPGQRNLVRGLVLQPDANKYSIDFITTFNLRSAGYVKRALSALKKKRVIENEHITDIFFAEWVRRRG